MLRPEPIGAIPEETVRVARAAFRKGSLTMQLRDELGTLYTDADFADLYPNLGQPALSPWRLALVTVLQFLENLTDRQVADQVRGRVDWKYALGLELTDPGFDRSVLSEFRTRLTQDQAESRLLDRLLEHFQAKGLIRARGHQRTDSTHVLAAVRRLQRLESAAETIRAALNALSAADPEWVRPVAQVEWFERYGHRVEDYRLPKGKAAREAYGLAVAADGFTLLDALNGEGTPEGLRSLPMIRVFEQWWAQNFIREGGRIRWRRGDELAPSGERFNSPYDPEAAYSTRREHEWIGYKVHVSETCDADLPHLITHVHTTNSTVQDVTSTAPIHAALAQRNLLPEKHIVDAGYIDADLLASSTTEYGVNLIGPTRENRSWQARAGTGYDASHFQIDWDHCQVTCPQGATTRGWYPTMNRFGTLEILIQFHRDVCGACAVRSLCTKAKGGRRVVIQPREKYEALRLAREYATSQEWQALYHQRAGIEGTLSQGTRALGLRRTRYRGLRKTALQHAATGAAINVLRAVSWLNGDKPGRTRVSRFSQLAVLI
jgi:transposase